MKFATFRELIKKYPFFRSNLFPLLTDNPNFLRRQVVDWVKQGRLIELKRGIYTLSEKWEDKTLSPYLLANIIYSPSYISLESALSHYNLIPERVEVITSVTSKKTQTFENKFGKFTYRHIKQSCYEFFIANKDKSNLEYFIATPEKALLDYLYLNTPPDITIEKDYFYDALRLQNVTSLNPRQLLKIANVFQQNKLMHSVRCLISLIEEEK